MRESVRERERESESVRESVREREGRRESLYREEGESRFTRHSPTAAHAGSVVAGISACVTREFENKKCTAVPRRARI